MAIRRIDVWRGVAVGCKMGLTVESEEGEVPHLRWSQAPPLPWPRPGSADMIIFSNMIINDYIFIFQ